MGLGSSLCSGLGSLGKGLGSRNWRLGWVGRELGCLRAGSMGLVIISLLRF